MLFVAAITPRGISPTMLPWTVRYIALGISFSVETHHNCGGRDELYLSSETPSTYSYFSATLENFRWALTHNSSCSVSHALSCHYLSFSSMWSVVICKCVRLLIWEISVTNRVKKWFVQKLACKVSNNLIFLNFLTILPEIFPHGLKKSPKFKLVVD